MPFRQAKRALAKLDGVALRGSLPGEVFLDEDPQVVGARRCVEREGNGETGRRERLEATIPQGKPGQRMPADDEIACVIE